MIKTPFIATDGIINLYNNDNEFLGYVFISRKNEPYGIALPGGFVDIGESVEDALVREMKEEVSLDVEILSLHGVYSNPNRDKRFHCVSVVYECKAIGTPKAADDAKEVFVYKKEDIPLNELVFDHKNIITDYFDKK